MGVRHSQGDGVARDDVRAVEYFKMAAEQSHVDAQ